MFRFEREILSPSNATVKSLVRLHSRRHRRMAGKTLIDGVRPCLVALRSGYILDEIYVCPELYHADDDELRELAEEATVRGVVVVQASRAVADKIACRENSDGVIGVAATINRSLADFLIGEKPLILVMEGIEKPGNLGAMLRTADGAGVDAVIVCDPTTDLGNPNVIRASMGTVFSMNIAVADAEQVHGWLRDKGVSVIAASPEATGTYWDADFCGACAIAVGAEHAGLSESWRQQQPDLLPVSIPMVGQADSLNVATAAALMIYEAIRQRRD